MSVLGSISGSLVNEIAHFVREAGLPGIFVLMAISAACIPIPSEAVMLFAGFAVADPARSASSHHMTLLGIVSAGVLGSMLGSWVAYLVGRGGRLELIERHGAKIHISPAQVERADRWFARYGDWAVLFGRMVPFVRAFVSLPAGAARMPLARFSVLSLIGSIPWVLLFALLGEALGSEWTAVRKGFEYADYVILGAIVLAIAWSLARRVRRAPTPPDRGALVDASGKEAVEPTGADTTS